MMCEHIIDDLRILKTPPMIGQNGKPKKMVFMNKLNEMRIVARFDEFITPFEERFQCEYFGMHSMIFEWYPSNTAPEPPKSDGVTKMKGKWQRYKEIDFTGIIWLNDYNDSTDFDETFEVYGGSLEFPTFDVSFRPERGTMIIFPSASNFIHTTSAVQHGSLTQVRLTIRTETPYEYKPENFDANHENWNLG